MSAMPDTSLGRRSIGEILLEHGYVTKEQVDEANALQLESGRPLGQILVEAGTITRLELASALAEQWSDSGAPIAPPDGLSLSGTLPALEPFEPVTHTPGPAHAEVVSRLDSLEEALERLRVREDAREDDDRLADLRAALETITRRVEGTEPAIEELARRLELYVVDPTREGRVDELAAAVAGLQERLATLGQAAEGAAEQSGRVAEETAASLEQVREQLAALSARLPSLAEGEELEELRAVVESVSERPARDPGLSAQIEDLQAVVETLAARPARDPDLVAQIEDLQAVVETLSQRPARDAELGAQIEDLQAVVESLASRPARDAELAAQVDTIGLRLADLADRLSVLGGSVESLSGDADALRELKGALAELAQRPLADPASERRLDELARAVDELATRPVADPEAEQRLAKLTAAVEELSRRPAADPAAEQRLGELAAAVEELAHRPVAGPEVETRLAELATTVAELAHRPAADPAAERRLEELSAALEDLRANMQALSSRPAGDPELDAKLFEITSRLAELERGDLVAELHARVVELAERPAIDPSLVQRISLLESRLEALPGDEVLEALDAGDRTLGFRIDGVVARVDEVAAALEQAGGSGVPREAWDEAVGLLNSRIDVERELETRIAQLEQHVAQVASGTVSQNGEVVVDPQLAQQVAALTARVEQLAAGAPPPEGGEGEDGRVSTATPATLERDVEHVLMAIERLSVHLGAHERALTELMGASGLVAQMRELAARVSDLETYGGGGGTGGGGGGDGEMRAELRSLMRRLEDAESAQKQDRERVIQQLEKAAGAIDWRLQRLESGRGDDQS
jgi:hypothetical protein